MDEQDTELITIGWWAFHFVVTGKFHFSEKEEEYASLLWLP